MKVGDTVAWADVPSGAMVRHDQILYMRVGDAGWGVGHSARVHARAPLRGVQAVNKGSVANKRMHFRSHKRNAFRVDVRENKAARALQECRDWAAPDLDDLRYKGFNGAAAVRLARDVWECELEDAYLNGWEWGVYETSVDRYI